MNCGSCGSTQSDEHRFCTQCGTRLRVLCPACASVNPPDARYCARCGAPVGQNQPEVAAAGSSADRRQVTVLFCDMVDSTKLAQQLDPEELRDVITAYVRSVTAAVERHNGYVAKLMGDGVLVYFGYPQAHEKDAQRAIDAGLDMVASVRSLELGVGPLSARVGIATGLVVVGEVIGQGESAERGILGQAPNLAARLQGVAAAGAIVVDTVTHDLAADLFDYHALGSLSLKGFAAAITAYEVRGRQSAEMNLRRISTAGTPLVGRQEELERICRRWDRARDGEGSVVAVSAEAGIGKTKLLVATTRAVGWTHEATLWLFGAPHHQHSPFHPFIDLMGRMAGWAGDDSAQERIGKLAALPLGADHVAALCAILGLVTGEAFGLADAQERRRLAMEAVIALIEDKARHGPLAVVVEDAHWLDPTSAELLDRLVVWTAGRAAMLVVSHRPDYRPTWAGLSHVMSLVLTRLGAPESAELVRALDTAGALSEEAIARIVERTDGVPLFVEELTKAAASDPTAAGVSGDTTSVLPPTLQATLLAQIDRLDPQAREVMQVAACMGREFSMDIVAAVSGIPPDRVESILSDLAATGVVTRNWTRPGASFAFRHALLHDAAYGLLLRSERRRIHGRLADALLNFGGSGLGSLPQIVARHLEEGARWNEAVPLWIKAGDQAIASAAHDEAVSLLQRALHALEQTAQGPDRQSLTIDVRWRLHNALYPLGRLREAIDNLLESERCAEALGERHRLGSVLTSQAYALAALGDLTRAAESAARAVDLSQTASTEQHAGALLMLARTLYAAGRYTEAADRSGTAVALLAENVEAGMTVGLNSTVSAHVWLSLCLAEQGQLDRAETESAIALRLAQHHSCRFHETLWASIGASRQRLLQGLHQPVVDILLPLVAHCEGAFRVYLPRVASTLGASLHAIGKWEEGDRWLVEADAVAAAIGFGFGHALVLALASEAHLRRGRVQEAGRSAERALELARQYGERGNEARARYALAEAHVAAGDPVSAHSEFSRAMNLAESLGMKQVAEECRTASTIG